jgi:uncharacterized membrane protein (DUF485 family)
MAESSEEPDEGDDDGDDGERSQSTFQFSLPSTPFPYRLGRPFDFEEEREKTRKLLAVILAVLLFLTALALIFLTAFKALSIDEAKDLAATVLSPVIAVTGTALGFYFGGHRGSK